jgi:hypothetical protein
MVYISNLNYRNDIPIDNKYDIINDTIDDFHIVVYYLDINKCKVIIRRLDNESGWGINLKIKIYDINEDINQILSLGSNEYNDKIININTNIKLYKHEYKNQKIPKTIIQTISSKNIENINHYNSILTFIELNPEYKYVIYDDNESRKFIKDNFDERTLVAYDLLIPGAFKADFFRYCCLYINGGCYFDCKMILLYPLRTIINSEDEYILVRDGDNLSIYNAVMLFNKRVENLMHLINHITNTVLNRVYVNNELELTGPKIICNFFKDYNFNLQHIFTGVNYDNYKNYYVVEKNNLKRKILYKFFSGYYKDYFQTSSYKVLFEKKEIYYCNRIEVQNYVIYIYPHNTNDKFDFSFYDKNLLRIRRIDNDSGWGQNMKIKIINEDTNIEKKYDIGAIEFNNYIFRIDF